jgi:hypothetical protein
MRWQLMRFACPGRMCNIEQTAGYEPVRFANKELRRRKGPCNAGTRGSPTPALGRRSQEAREFDVSQSPVVRAEDPAEV